MELVGSGWFLKDFEGNANRTGCEARRKESSLYD